MWFASYFREGFWIDHWVVEYWNDNEWVTIDPDAGRDVVSRDEFHHSGVAWMLCRNRKLDPATHGNYFLWGWDELRGSLINDIGALNKVECGNWSWCSLIDIAEREKPHGAVDKQLDDLASLVLSSGSFEELRLTYQREAYLHPPP